MVNPEGFLVSPVDLRPFLRLRPVRRPRPGASDTRLSIVINRYPVLKEALCLRPHRLAWPRTPAFQAGNTGSNPVGDAKMFSPGTDCIRFSVSSGNMGEN